MRSNTPSCVRTYARAGPHCASTTLLSPTTAQVIEPSIGFGAPRFALISRSFASLIASRNADVTPPGAFAYPSCSTFMTSAQTFAGASGKSRNITSVSPARRPRFGSTCTAIRDESPVSWPFWTWMFACVTVAIFVPKRLNAATLLRPCLSHENCSGPDQVFPARLANRFSVENRRRNQQYASR